MSALLESFAAVKPRSVVLVSPDKDLRQRLSDRLCSMRWQVFEAGGGAEAMVLIDRMLPEALIVDHWLPDLDADEFTGQVARMCPATDLLQVDGTGHGSGRSSRRNELLHALREAQDAVDVLRPKPPQRAVDGAAWNAAPAVLPISAGRAEAHAAAVHYGEAMSYPAAAAPQPVAAIRMALPELVGDTAPMRELASMVRLVAPRSTTVLILGETGTGKEIVAKAVHRLSDRAGKPFAVLNCAAIPEQLLEAELFGHTRGAFTGAVASRTGRIEAAHGGTLFLDEIGEMPLPLQAKMLRFLECGELQRIGDNETLRVDVRIVAATHQPLQENASRNTFRLDLYHRLAVFPVEIASLRQRTCDIPMLVEYRLQRLGEVAPRRSIRADALALLMDYHWPGNVRELCHVLERATILCGDSPEILPEHIRLYAAPRAAAAAGGTGLSLHA